jgi:F420-0:gamma-glutamyl ligase
MKVIAYKTKKIKMGDNLFEILDTYLPKLEERNIVVITSKIISICQGDVVKNDGKIKKEKLIKEQADEYYEDENLKVWGTVLPTITHNVFVANAGIDESNADGNFILLPKNIDKVIEKIGNYLREKYNIKHLGIIVTDSHVGPMRYGTLGVGISWC